jgi:predicted ATPase
LGLTKYLNKYNQDDHHKLATQLEQGIYKLYPNDPEAYKNETKAVVKNIDTNPEYRAKIFNE